MHVGYSSNQFLYQPSTVLLCSKLLPLVSLLPCKKWYVGVKKKLETGEWKKMNRGCISMIPLSLHIPSPIVRCSSPSSSNNCRDGNYDGPSVGWLEEGKGRVNVVGGGDFFKWRLVLAYDGTLYKGWQFQQSSQTPTVQCILEKALITATKLERQQLALVGASRTDTGVHAWGQTVHFVTPFNFHNTELENLHAALNGLLPSDVRVRLVSPAPIDFHARFSTISKLYRYTIYNGPVMDPFLRKHAYHSTYNLNAAAMREAAHHFVGTHDFSAFANASRDRNSGLRNPVKTILRFDVIQVGALLQLEVEGSGFLYRQVRNMVALLMQIGKEALPPDVVPKMLATCDRKELAKCSFLCTPPHGLCLVSVNYNEEHLQLPSASPPPSFGRHHTITKCKLPFYY